MAGNNQEFLKKDLVYILQLNSQIQYDNKLNVQQAHDMVMQKKLFKTVLGQKYVKRLEQLINGTDALHKCVLCGNDLDNATLVCMDCLAKYKLTPPSRQEAVTPAQEEASTPEQHEASTAPFPKLWLFPRVLIAFLASFILLYVCVTKLNNLNAVPGLLFMGALALPFSVLVFMFEINVSKNISIFEVMKMFFFGGMVSQVLTLCLFEAFPIGWLNYSSAIIVGLIYALGRLFIIAVFVKLLNPKHILDGMLIGAAVGAGFAALEIAGYAFRFYLLSGGNINYLTEILLLRTWSALGGHAAWAAITGGGLVMAKGDMPFSFKLFTDIKFLKFFFIPVILHAIWDCPFMDSGVYVYIKLAVLIVIAWIIILGQINAGLKQLERKSSSCPKPSSI